MHHFSSRFQYILTPIFLALLILLLHSCRKDEDPQFQEYTCISDCYSIEGYILQGQDSTALAGAKLDFTKHYNQFNTDLLASKTSDSSGYFKFEIPVSYFKNTSHFIGIDIVKDGIVNSPYHDLVLFDSTDVGSVKRMDFVLYKASKLLINLHNDPDTDFGSVSIECEFNLERVSDTGWALHDSPTFKPQLEFKVPSDLPTIVSWHTYQSELNINGETTITVPRDSTYTIDIYL